MTGASRMMMMSQPIDETVAVTFDLRDAGAFESDPSTRMAVRVGVSDRRFIRVKWTSRPSCSTAMYVEIVVDESEA